jgi:hypothetical protein
MHGIHTKLSLNPTAFLQDALHPMAKAHPWFRFVRFFNEKLRFLYSFQLRLVPYFLATKRGSPSTFFLSQGVHPSMHCVKLRRK